MASERYREIWDDATNAVCQAMQEQKMCNCPDGDCLAAKIDFSPEKIATATRPAPAATDTGLETVAKVDSRLGDMSRLSIIDRPLSIGTEVCLRSQAEELLAAKDAAYERLEHQALKDRKLRSEAQSDADLWRFSVDMGDHPSLLVKLWRQRKAIEAKLTAAEKALEPFSKFAGAVFERNFNKTDVIFEISASDGGMLELKGKDFFQARAVLGEKPS